MQNSVSALGVIVPTAVISLILLIISVTLFIMLRRTLKKKFYSYTNIALIAAALFMGIYFVVSLIAVMRYTIMGSSITGRDILIMLIEYPSDFSLFAVPILLIVCFMIFISNIALIKHEGFRVFNLLGAILGALIVVAVSAVNALSYIAEQHLMKYAGGEKQILLSTWSVLSLFMVTMLCYFECIYAGTIIMAALAVRRRPGFDKDFMIILGCSIDKRGGLLPLLKSRTNRAIKFAWEQEVATGKSMRYVPSGGQGPNEIISEGSAMELYLLSHGVEEEEIIAEKRSKDTYENFVFSKKLIDEVMPNAKVAFATTNYHILRSGILARYAGLDAEGIASDTKWYFWPNGFVREFIAILVLKKKTHIKVAGVIFVLSVLLGVAGYLLV